MKSIYSNQSKT